jgi:DNA-binding transcriptional ArsR family regulator
VLSLLTSPRRREILRLLRQGERPAGVIHAALGDVTFGAVSQHLKVLEAAGLVTSRRDGRRRWYRARPERLGPLRAWLEEMWDSSLYRLKLQAELEAARRGPRARRPPSGPRRHRPGRTRS